MKTFLIDTIKHFPRININYHLMSYLKSNEWVIFTDDSDAEKLLFLADNELLILKNGKYTSSRWRYLSVNTSIVIGDDNDNLLFKIVSCDKNLMVLNLEGSLRFCFLINSKSHLLDNCSFPDIQWYLIRNCNIDLLTDLQRDNFEKENQRRKQLELEEEEKREREAPKIFMLIITAIIIITIIAAIIN